MSRMMLFLIKVGVGKGPTLEACRELNFVFHQKVDVKVRVQFLSKVGS
jgi:hypothetical protein